MNAAPVPAERREIQLAGTAVSFELARRPRRSIGLTIDQRGLRVAAPRRASLREIEGVLAQHADWVVAKLQEWQGRAAARPVVAPGAVVQVLGRARCVRLAAPGESAGVDGDILRVHPQAPFGLFARAALHRLALEVFGERLAHFAARAQRPVPPLALSDARARWGSCNRRGEIRLNWRLIHFDLAVIDYVVAHELAHGVEMNHSPRFWAQVEALCPDYAAQRRRLREAARMLPDYDFSL